MKCVTILPFSLNSHLYFRFTSYVYAWTYINSYSRRNLNLEVQYMHPKVLSYCLIDYGHFIRDTTHISCNLEHYFALRARKFTKIPDTPSANEEWSHIDYTQPSATVSSTLRAVLRT
jgi:hypothetical protein